MNGTGREIVLSSVRVNMVRCRTYLHLVSTSIEAMVASPLASEVVMLRGMIIF